MDLTAGPADPDPAAELARTLSVGGRSAAEPTESLRRYLADRDEVTPTQFEVEMLVAGDLAGMAPQPVGSKH